jgi:hypothetical protein
MSEILMGNAQYANLCDTARGKCMCTHIPASDCCCDEMSAATAAVPGDGYDTQK